MSFGKRLIWGGVGIALVCASAFSAVRYESSNKAYRLSGGPQIEMVTASLKNSMGRFSETYAKLTGPSLEQPYVDISDAREKLKEASSGLDAAVREAEKGIEVLGLNGFDKNGAEGGLKALMRSRESVNSIIASLPTGSMYHGGREQSILVEANTAANEALQVLRRTPSGADYGLWRTAAVGTGIMGIFSLLTGTVLYRRLAAWANKEEAKVGASATSSFQ